MRLLELKTQLGEWSWRLRSRFLSYEKTLTVLVTSFALSLALMNFEFHYLEAFFYDLRVSYGNFEKPNPNIVLVTVDDDSIRGSGEFSPLSLKLHTRFLERLRDLQPRALGYVIDLNLANQINPENLRGEWSQRFLSAVTHLQVSGVPVLFGTPYDINGEVIPPDPLSSLPHALAIIHRDGNVFSDDRVTRRALLTLNRRNVFHTELANRLGLKSPEPMRGSFRVPEADGEYFFFRYHGNPTLKWEPGDQQPYLRISFIDIIENRVNADRLKNKIVLVGTLSQESNSDFVLTPFARSFAIGPKLLVHANILDSVLKNNGILRLGNVWNWVITFILTLFVIAWVFHSSPLVGLLTTFGLSIIFLLVGHLLFQVNGIWVKESHPIMGIFFGYYLVVPYRLIREYKKRWDYQRKTEMLTQVEELKTNFMSLVTHDLKTPVARIQGLAEMILRRSHEHLTHLDQEQLKNVISSTDELNHFISSILELSKIESEKLKLNKESKDINQIIEKSVETFRAAASSKKVKITTNLEPLFPIKIDSALISKVINTLLDNAIKYSFQSTKANNKESVIHVHSVERDQEVIVSVRDHGIGLSTEEKENLFTRFYRAKNEATAQNAGTGLGLYLTKYFIEAHQGRVEIESESGKGSEFRIVLPIEGSN